jgi:hypothetical protein
MVSSARPVAADQNTRIYNFTAYESGGVVNISGVLQYHSATGLFLPLNATKVKFYWWTTDSVLTNYIGEVYSNDKTASDAGWFYFTWRHGLEPGKYYLRATYDGGDSYTAANGVVYTLQSCQSDTRFVIALRLKITLDTPTKSVMPRASASVTVTVEATNSNTPHPVTLSTVDPSNNFASRTFSTISGNTPLASRLTLNVPNATRPGTYVVTVVATSQENSSLTVTTPLLIFIQQNTYALSVEIQGLPGDVQTSLYLDESYLEKIGSGLGTLTVSNKTRVISVSKEIILGDILYSCQAYRKTADPTATITFSYDTEYRLHISSNLPQAIISKLVLVVNGGNETIDNFKPGQGYDEFLPQNAQISFAIAPTYITTDDVNYKLNEWRDITTGEQVKPSNASSNELYKVTLDRPIRLQAYFDRWVVVTIKSNLPSDMSTTLQIGNVGSEKKYVSVPGSVAYRAGEFVAGSTFECIVGQDQYVLLNAGGNTRYAFQGLTPPSPVTVARHTTISINYAMKYKVQVVSNFEEAILQPSGGVGWFASGDIATLQVRDQVRGKNGIPYVFDGWTGSLSSSKTLVSFPVAAPMQVEAQWRVNWTYLLTMGAAVVGILAPATFIVKWKISRWRKKSAGKTRERTKRHTGEDDSKLYKYIIEKGGSLKINDAMKDLQMTREEINDSIKRLKRAELLQRKL